MSTAFAFGFDTDDIDEDEQGEPCIAAQSADGRISSISLIQPQLYTLQEIVGSVPLCIL